MNNLYYYMIGFLILLGITYFFQPRVFKKTTKFILYSNPITTLLRGKLLGVILPGFAGAYYITLDIWADEWPIISNHKATHSSIFKILIAASLLSLVVRAIADWIIEEKDKDYILFLQSLSILTSKLVKSKLDRFKQIATGLSPKANTFKKITQPDKQINLLLTEVESLFKNHFSIKEENFSIVIIRVLGYPNSEEKKSYYIFKNHKSWNRTKAKNIIENGKSIAAKCLKIGEAIFLADKIKASQDNEYYMTKRDQRMKGGSVFCYPSITNTGSYEDKYVISISTYERMLCDPDDLEEINAIKSILNDICRRIDLELTLHSIKDWQFEFCGKPK